ncbi:hypothetical protein G4Y79_03990 [Phototrophicus methaneseepsis]|uniref:HEAT repeat domain-containing protein n=1 Tax=Phototrophicus methaneseepsis TaxID=2710758 RepID=A0A7S8EB20_9CHLR|nr:hypothetical protein [Phototrophicus methaneseepsis]QPC83554.1 hypothetical protein G4Y79_03990 [Phototrophicus methaneseepsis]
MDTVIKATFENLYAKDKAVQNDAYDALMEATQQPVDWAYDVWDELVAGLTHKDNHIRAITSQILCQLAISDPDQRMMKDFDVLLNVTRDERFVTARHCLQTIWKVGLAGEQQRQMVMDGLTMRYQDCTAEKNTTLIRYDIIQDLRHLYDATGDESVKSRALMLIETEPDTKYRKKYATIWKNA